MMKNTGFWGSFRVSRKSCGLCIIFVNLNKKKSISTTPLSAALKDLILALKDSAEALLKVCSKTCKE